MHASHARRLLPSLLLPLTVVVGGCAGRAVSATGTPAVAPVARLDAFISAHPDDWQLFMGDVAVDAMRAGGRTVFVHSTAGDAGRGEKYWRARERGALASMAFGAGYGPPDSVTQLAAGSPPIACTDTAVLGRSARRCAIGRAAMWFLRIPDGNGDGSGFEATGMRSLLQLGAGGAALAPMEGAGTYARVEDLGAVMAAILRAEAALAGAPRERVRVHANDTDTLFNPNDHSDHKVTARVAAGIAAAEGWPLVRYASYSSSRFPTNLNAERFATKAGLFMAYDRARVLADPGWSAYAEGPKDYSPWLSRTYVRPASLVGSVP